MSKGQRWTESEESKLASMYANGRAWVVIEQRLDRPKHVLRDRLLDMNRRGIINLDALEERRRRYLQSVKEGTSIHADGKGHADRGAAVAGLKQLNRQSTLQAAIEHLTKLGRLTVKERHGHVVYELDGKAAMIGEIYHAMYDRVERV